MFRVYGLHYYQAVMWWKFKSVHTGKCRDNLSGNEVMWAPSTDFLYANQEHNYIVVCSCQGFLLYPTRLLLECNRNERTSIVHCTVEEHLRIKNTIGNKTTKIRRNFDTDICKCKGVVSAYTCSFTRWHHYGEQQTSTCSLRLIH